MFLPLTQEYASKEVRVGDVISRIGQIPRLPRKCVSSPSSSRAAKTGEIALRLKTTEQVIKNYLRSIYDKTGVSDRLELALFTIHHRQLAQAAAEMGKSKPKSKPPHHQPSPEADLPPSVGFTACWLWLPIPWGVSLNTHALAGPQCNPPVRQLFKRKLRLVSPSFLL